MTTSDDAALRRAGGALARAEGRDLYTACDAILKGVLESEVAVSRLVGSARPPFLALLRRAAEPAVEALLARHACECVSVVDAARAVSLAGRVASAGRAAVLLLTNDQLFYAMPALQALAALPSGGALALLVEDNPELAPAASPRALTTSLGAACLEPHDLESLRDSVEIALRLSRASARPTAICVDVGRLRSLDTLEARPNRVVDRLDAAAAGRRVRRGPRPGEPLDLMRLARRLELNVARAMPSPGERAPLGLLVAGNALQATRHLLAEVGLEGRVPVVGLGLTHPLDDALVLRLLQRCDQVVVLETRPGGLATELAEIVERSRRRGEQPASLWWRLVPGDGEQPAELEPGDALRPSSLARDLLGLLHMARPGLRVASRLASVPAELADLRLEPRGERLGASGAARRVREAISEVDRIIRRDEEERGIATALALDGVEPAATTARVVPVEIWDRKRFAFEGPAAIRQAIRARGARLMIACDVGGEDEVDVARLARAAMPAEPSEQLVVNLVDLHDRAGLRGAILEAVRADRLTVIVARDGPPPRLDPIAAERALADEDRLGYAPRQRLVWLAESACELAGSASGAVTLRPLEDPPPLRSRAWMRRLRIRSGAAVRLRIRPFLEQVDAVRTAPPAATARGEDTAGLPPPRPLHAAQPRWRAHLAGFRGEAAGVVATVLAEAGRLMGYRAEAAWEPTPIGPGRRAWAQVLFTRPTPLGSPALVPEIPYGEADLVLGLEPEESLRALGPDPRLRVASPDRTHAVINSAPLEDAEIDAGLMAALGGAVRRTCREDAVLEDLAAPCRAAFLTERLLDLVLLGFAFQRGLVPVSADSLQQALRRVEERGFGRCVEAVALGRRLAVQSPGRAAAADSEDVARAVRRVGHGIAGRRGLSAARFRDLLESSLGAMPGLLETRSGRLAAVEFVEFAGGAMAWGGIKHAARYADRIRRLYAVDRGDTGRELVRLAIAPVAEAILVRDLFHVASMSLSPRHLAWLRSRLRLRSSRGDRLERRFLFRVDGLALGRRFRLDLRTSDWLPIVLTRLRRLWPWRWRGTPRERQLRDAVLAGVERAISEIGRSGGDEAVYRQWTAEFRRIRATARRLRGPAVLLPTISAPVSPRSSRARRG